MNLGMPEIILLSLVILLLFGGKKIPELMKGLGKGVKSFKDGVNGIEDDMNDEKKSYTQDKQPKQEVK
jgi:sec-independent protein translocase protein TatA